MTIGSHIRIIGKHPHSGKTGRIWEPVMWDALFVDGVKQAKDDWVIRLDKEALDCTVAEKDIEVIK
jgi:hypothetical protein